MICMPNSRTDSLAPTYMSYFRCLLLTNCLVLLKTLPTSWARFPRFSIIFGLREVASTFRRGWKKKPTLNVTPSFTGRNRNMQSSLVSKWNLWVYYLLSNSRMNPVFGPIDFSTSAILLRIGNLQMFVYKKYVSTEWRPLGRRIY